MSLLEGKLEIPAAYQQLLSPEEIAARHALAHLFGKVVGSNVEIMGIGAAMTLFYRSEQGVHYTGLYKDIREIYAVLVELDSALTVHCMLAQMKKDGPRLYTSKLEINYGDGNRHDLPETVIDYLGEMAEGRYVNDWNKIVVNDSSSPDELVRRHNDREFNRLRYESQLPIENFAAQL